MVMTLLDMVQSILSSLNSDEVNSISDTTESMQIANIVQTVYFNIVTRAGLVKHDKLLQLTAAGDTTRPVLMYSPDDISKIEWLKYFNTNVLEGTSDQFGAYSHDLNTDLVPGTNPPGTSPEPGYQYVTILPIRQFLDMINGFNPSDIDVFSFEFNSDSNNFTFYYKNSHQPKYCTMLENKYVIFDAFDSTQDTTLQSSKTLCFGQFLPSFSLIDTFVPDLDPQQFPLLLNEAKSLAFFELKQTTHAKAEQESKRQWSSVQKDKSLSNRPSYFEALPSFGRQRGTGGYAIRQTRSV